MLNRIELIGRLTRDPEVRYISGGHPLGVLSYTGETPCIVFHSSRL
jgi:single-stranded DNA-binding protein